MYTNAYKCIPNVYKYMHINAYQMYTTAHKCTPKPQTRAAATQPPTYLVCIYMHVCIYTYIYTRRYTNAYKCIPKPQI